MEIIRVAQNISKLGFKEDDVLAVIARNSEHLAPIVFASMSIGCPVNALDPSFGKAEIVHMLRITKPKLIFCDVDKLPAVRESLKELEWNLIIFTFNGKTEDSRSVNELLVKTGREDEFLYVQAGLRLSRLLNSQ